MAAYMLNGRLVRDGVNGVVHDAKTGQPIDASTGKPIKLPGSRLDDLLPDSPGASTPEERAAVATTYAGMGTPGSLPKGPTMGDIEVSEDPGAGPSDTDTRSPAGFKQTGRNLGPKPINIPEFKVNPFELAGLSKPNPNQATIGGKKYDVDEEAQADSEKKEEKYVPDSYNGEFGGDYGIYEDNPGPSALEVGRRSAILDAPYGAGPMEILRRRNESLGTAYEIDDNKRMTGRTVFNNNGTAEILGEGQDKEYYGDPQKFLKGVLDGSVTIGGKEEEVEAPDLSGVTTGARSTKGYPGMFQEDGVDFEADTGINIGAKTFPTQDVDFTDMSSIIPFDEAGAMPDPTETVDEVGDEFNGALTHEEIDGLPKILGPKGELVPDFSHLYK